MDLAADVKLEDLARMTPGFAGADLANLVNEAALAAARRGMAQVERVDFQEALDKLLLGAKREALMDEHERRIVAYHEGGTRWSRQFYPMSIHSIRSQLCHADAHLALPIFCRRMIGATIHVPTCSSA